MDLIGLELMGPALGVAISPLPVMIVLLLLVARNVRSAVSYVLGWMLGLLIVGVLLVFLADFSLHQGNSTESTTIGIASMILGLLFLAMAFVTLAGKNRKRPTAAAVGESSQEIVDSLGQAEQGINSKSETAREMTRATATPMTIDSDRPGWMRAIDRVSPLLALSIALVSAFNPKNLSMILMAIADIHEAGFDGIRGSIAYLNFVFLATITVAAPLLYWVIKREDADDVLRRCERWLSANQAYIMFGLFLVLGLMALIKGWQRLPG